MFRRKDVIRTVLKVLDRSSGRPVRLIAFRLIDYSCLIHRLSMRTPNTLTWITCIAVWNCKHFHFSCRTTKLQIELHKLKYPDHESQFLQNNYLENILILKFNQDAGVCCAFSTSSFNLQGRGDKGIQLRYGLLLCWFNLCINDNKWYVRNLERFSFLPKQQW